MNQVPPSSQNPPPAPNPPTAPSGSAPPTAGPGRQGMVGKPYATFGIRLWAYFLDSILYGLVAFVFTLVAYFIGAGQFTCNDVSVQTDSQLSYSTACEVTGSTGLVLLAALIAFVGWIITVFLYLRDMAKTGQTWGARIAGVRVVTATGEAPGWGKAIGRTLMASFVSIWFFHLGYLWMLWDDQKQTWQDKVASTYVIRD